MLISKRIEVGVICTLWYLLAITNVVVTRKYNLETISQNLYKENFSTILYKFRRSPEYTDILNNWFQPFYENFQQSILTIMLFYQTQMTADITKMIELESPPKTTKVRSFVDLQNNKNFARSATPKPSIARSKTYTLSVGTKKESNNTTWAATLDAYPKFHMLLSAARRNEFRDVAFQYAARFFATVETSLLNRKRDDKGYKSTKATDQEEEPDKPEIIPDNESAPVIDNIQEKENEEEPNLDDILEAVPAERSKQLKKGPNKKKLQVKKPIKKARDFTTKAVTKSTAKTTRSTTTRATTSRTTTRTTTTRTTTSPTTTTRSTSKPVSRKRRLKTKAGFKTTTASKSESTTTSRSAKRNNDDEPDESGKTTKSLVEIK